ncbi:MAG: L,D-transpeptidase [Thermoleophilaceae bacterium]|nr:L,D-transpeptidase [Thermoleophilaceae bacterium]
MDTHASALLSRLLAVTFAVTVSAFALAGPAMAAGAKGSYTETLLSNELDTSRWAFVSKRVSAFSRPGERGRKLRTLTRHTPDRTSELVLTLRERIYSDGTVWTEARLPMRSQATGWIRRSALDKYRVVHSRIEIDRGQRTAKLFKNEQVVWSAPIAIGRSGHTTPAGNFYVRNRLASTDKNGRFGPFAIGLSAYARTATDWPGHKTVGIHGTNKPKQVPGTSSDPCVHVTNDQIRALFKLAPPGIPVKIL